MKLDHNEFEAFWAVYPRRVAKIDAMKAYAQARKTASAADILAGVERYKRTKPDWCEWKHPGPWLRAGRWMDEGDVSVAAPAREYWGDECARLHGSSCRKRWDHDIRMQTEQVR